MIDHFPMNAHLTTKSFKTKPITSNKKWNNKLGFFCLDSDFLKSHFLDFQTLSQCLKITKKCRIWFLIFGIFHQIFVLLKLICLVTLFDRKLQVFKKSPKLTIFGIFN